MAENFVSPLVASLSKLVKSDEYKAFGLLLDSEEKRILAELHNAPDDRTLTIIQGKYRMLKRLRTLPEETIDRYLNEKEGK